MARARNRCCNEKAKMNFVCRVELRVTVNNTQILCYTNML